METSVGTISAAAALVFAVNGLPVLALMFSVLALAAAVFAVRSVNELGRLVKQDAEDQQRRIQQVGGKVEEGDG